jgi:hypothetical protein
VPESLRKSRRTVLKPRRSMAAKTITTIKNAMTVQTCQEASLEKFATKRQVEPMSQQLCKCSYKPSLQNRASSHRKRRNSNLTCLRSTSNCRPLRPETPILCKSRTFSLTKCCVHVSAQPSRSTLWAVKTSMAPATLRLRLTWTTNALNWSLTKKYGRARIRAVALISSDFIALSEIKTL